MTASTWPFFTRSPRETLSEINRPESGVSTAAVRAGSDSTTAGNAILAFTGCAAAGFTVNALRSADPSGTTIWSPWRTIRAGGSSFLAAAAEQPETMREQCRQEQDAQGDAAPQEGLAAERRLVIVNRHADTPRWRSRS